MSNDSFKRLHITPLTPALLDTILNPSARPLATDVSFHSIQTFPENSYGFVTLPTMEADKVSKKLNGSILKGKKLKIHEATPKRGIVEYESTNGQSPRAEKPSKKRKGSGDTVQGFELPSPRRVKRGWTEEPVKDKRARKEDRSEAKSDEKKRKGQRAKYTDHKECLFHAVPPLNKHDDGERDGKHKHKKKSRHQSDGVVVHEFKNTVPHPTFLRASGDTSEMGMTSEFVEGVGWVDRAGNVKEPSTVKSTAKKNRLPERSSPAQERIKSKDEGQSKGTPTAVDAMDSDETSSSGSTPSEDEDEEVEDKPGSAGSGDEDNSSSGTSASSSAAEESSSSESDDDEKYSEQQTIEAPVTAKQQIPSTPRTNSSKTNNPTEIHPLETLFKLPRTSEDPNSKPPLEVETQFSFFGAGNDEIDGDEQDNDDGHGNIQNMAEPQTPFTKLDLQSRNLRSAAPTPDTAAISRTKFWEEEESDDEPEDDSHDSPRPAAVASKQQKDEESDFAKWFWENRGDNNRAWKKRRREAAKEKRQRDNRKRGLRGK